MSTYRVKVSKSGVLYLPSDVRKLLGVANGGELLIIVKEDHVELRPIKSVFVLGAECRKIAEITVEEFEKESEQMQRELYG